MIIGITGTDGAGKGAVVEYLVNTKGFVHYSSREFLTAEIQREGSVVTRESLRLMGNKMRKEHGLDVIVQKALERMQSERVKDVIIESIRALAEVKLLKEKGGFLLAVDADQKIRYERITGRGSDSDKVSFAEFVDHEKIEMNDPDPNGMQKAAVIKTADYTIINNGSFKDLQKSIDLFIETYHD